MWIANKRLSLITNPTEQAATLQFSMLQLASFTIPCYYGRDFLNVHTASLLLITSESFFSLSKHKYIIFLSDLTNMCLLYCMLTPLRTDISLRNPVHLPHASSQP